MLGGTIKPRRLVLFEGPDGGGKTTTAKALAALDDYTYQHNGPPPCSTTAEIFWWQLQCLEPTDGAARWVVDRSWPSEQVYHPFAGRPDTFDPLVHRMFERYLLSVHGVVVLCLPSFNRAASAWQARATRGEELVIDLEEFSTIYEHYQTWARTSSVPVLTFDYERHSAGDLRTALRRAQGAFTLNPAPDHLAGNAGGARILIVGEQYNTNAAPEFGPFIPFAGPGRNGKFLNFELTKAGLTEWDLAWVNARTPRGTQTPPSILAKFARDREVAIITLGDTAKHWAQAALQNYRDISPVLFTLTHPAYHNRFKHGQPWELENYAEALRAFCSPPLKVTL